MQTAPHFAAFLPERFDAVHAGHARGLTGSATQSISSPSSSNPVLRLNAVEKRNLTARVQGAEKRSCLHSPDHLHGHDAKAK